MHISKLGRIKIICFQYVCQFNKYLYFLSAEIITEADLQML